MVRNKKNKSLGKLKPKTPPKSKAQGGPLRPTPAPGVVQSGGDTRPARVTAPPPVTASAPTTATTPPGPSSPLGVAPGQTPANYQPIAPPPVGGFTNLGAGATIPNPLTPPTPADRAVAIAQGPAPGPPPLPVQAMSAQTAGLAAQNQRTAQGTAQMNNATTIGSQIGTPGFTVTPAELAASGRTAGQAQAAGLPVDYSGHLTPENQQKLAQFNQPAPINGRPITPPPPAPHNNAGHTDADFEAMQAQHFGARGSAPQFARQQRGREESAARVAAGRERNAERREQEADARTTLQAAREMGVTVPEYKAIQQAERAEQQTIQRHEQQTRATRHEQRRESLDAQHETLVRQRLALITSRDNAQKLEGDNREVAVREAEARLREVEQQIRQNEMIAKVPNNAVDGLNANIQDYPDREAEAIANFNKVYGEGAAEAVLGLNYESAEAPQNNSGSPASPALPVLPDGHWLRRFAGHAPLPITGTP